MTSAINHQNNDLDDPLEELFNGAASGTPRPVRQPPASYQPPTFTEPCQKCGGTGSWRGRGKCFACDGLGTKTYKRSHEDRAASRTSRQQRRVSDMEGFVQLHKDVFDWLKAEALRNNERGGSFTFPQDLLLKFAQYGSLTDGQLDACRRLIAKTQERQVEAKARIEAAPVVEVSALEAAFEKARNYKRLPNQLGVKRLQLRLDTFVFKPASKHPGTIYVTDKTEIDAEGQALYLGKIVGGRFQAARACGEARAARVVAAAADPANAAKAYGQRFGQCCVCGRELTAEESISGAIGPICREKYGF